MGELTELSAFGGAETYGNSEGQPRMNEGMNSMIVTTAPKVNIVMERLRSASLCRVPMSSVDAHIHRVAGAACDGLRKHKQKSKKS